MSILRGFGTPRCNRPPTSCQSWEGAEKLVIWPKSATYICIYGGAIIEQAEDEPIDDLSWPCVGERCGAGIMGLEFTILEGFYRTLEMSNSLC